MEYVKALLLTIGLCTDVLIASISKGLCIRKLTWGKFLTISGFYTLIQGGFAMVSYQLEEDMARLIKHVDHWAAFVLLTLVGAVMLIRSYKNIEADQEECNLQYLAIAIIGIAISVDTLPIITTETFAELTAWIGAVIIATETWLIAVLGIWIGHKLAVRYRYKSEFAGGILLIVLGLKMLAVGVFRF